jgi:hypothetical protein
LIDNFAAALSAARKPAQVLSEVTFLLPASVIRILGRQGRERRQLARALFWRSSRRGFGLCRDQVFAWLRIYNRRLSENWTERELAHKADSAVRATYDKPRDWLLTGQQFQPRRIAMRVSGTSGCGQKIAKSMFSPRMPPMFSTPHVMRTPHLHATAFVGSDVSS